MVKGLSSHHHHRMIITGVLFYIFMSLRSSSSSWLSLPVSLSLPSPKLTVLLLGKEEEEEAAADFDGPPRPSNKKISSPRPPEEGLCIEKGKQAKGKWMLLLHSTYYYYPTRKQTGTLSLFFFFETNDVAPLWLSPVDSLSLALTRVLYIYTMLEKVQSKLHPKRRKPNK